MKQLNNVLIFLFILLLPTQLGKHFFFNFSYLFGIRVDYLAPTLYLTDIIAFLLILINIKPVAVVLKKKALLILFTVILVNFFFSLAKPVSMYRYIKLFEVLSLFVIFKKQTLPFRFLLLAFTTSAFAEFLLGSLQLINKHSLQGIFYFFGERYLTLSSPGVAKASLQGIEILRPYGTFSHPNSLAGFYLLLYVFFLTMSYPKEEKKYSFIFLKNVLLLFSTIIIFLSFSKASIAVFFLVSTVYILRSSLKRECLICFFSRLLIMVVLSMLFLKTKGDPQSLANRINLIKNALTIIVEHPLFGVGFGNYLIAQTKLPVHSLQILNQPVHNVFLLFFAEFGLLLGGILLVGIFRLIATTLKKTPEALYIVLVIILTGLFDHYWLTLEQNFLLLATVAGLLKSFKSYNERKL